jgi:glycosyltransferase involved in cell wall biosynthesis
MAEALAASVVIPTYNRAHLLPGAVESVLAAVGPDDEVIVVDDGSTDSTEESLAPYGDRVRYLRIPHGGAGRARNEGVRMATRPLVAFLDSDDKWMPDKLEVQRTLMQERPEVLFSFTDFAAIDKHGKVVHRDLKSWHGAARSWDNILGAGKPFSSLGVLPSGRDDFDVHIGDLYLDVLGGHYIATFTLMVRREAAGDELWFAEDLPTYEDLECHARLARKGLAAYIDCETATRQRHWGPRLTDANSYICASARLEIIRRVYQADPTFVSQHGDRLAQELHHQHLVKADWLIKQGRSREARDELHLAGSPPLVYRLLAGLPGGRVTAPLRGGARAVRRAQRAVRGRRARDADLVDQ